MFNTCIQWDSEEEQLYLQSRRFQNRNLSLPNKESTIKKKNTSLSDSRQKALPFANQFCSKKGVHLPSKRSFFRCLLLYVEDSYPFPTPLQKRDCILLQVFSKSQWCVNKLKSSNNTHTHTHLSLLPLLFHSHISLANSYLSQAHFNSLHLGA